MNLKGVLLGEISEVELLNYYNANLRFVRLPKYINGFVINCKQYTIVFINKNLSEIKIKDTILHELAHIELCHLNQCKDLFAFNLIKYEDEANEYIDYLKSKT